MTPLDEFTDYLQGIPGGNKSTATAAAIANDVQWYFDITPHSSTIQHEDILFNKQNLENFYHKIKITLTINHPPLLRN